MCVLNPIIEIQQLTHVYSAGTPFQRAALQGVDLTIYEGEVMGIIGHTGSGKSTLIQHLNGLLKPTEGKIFLQGRDIWEDPKKIKDVRFQVGLVFQYPEYQLFEETVYKDIAFGPTNMKLGKEEIDQRVRWAADMVELPDEILEKSPFELSGGQKRRVAIAGVMAMQPKVLILDEPTAGLDPAGQAAVLANIQRLHEEQGTTILFVSHSMDEVARNVDRVAVVNQGKIFCVGTPPEVFCHGDELREMGLNTPRVTQIMESLNRMGVAVDPAIYTLDEARKAILAFRRKGDAPC